jgi:hypothetical protein
MALYVFAQLSLSVCFSIDSLLNIIVPMPTEVCIDTSKSVMPPSYLQMTALPTPVQVDPSDPTSELPTLL